MTNKNRLAKLESAQREDAAGVEYKAFAREVRVNGERYFIGAAQVDAATYEKELAVYRPLAQARGVPSEIVCMLASHTHADV